MDRILIIDPDDRSADLMSRGLMERGYTVDRTDGGSRAADLAIGGDYALVVLDLLLARGADGTGVLREIHEQRPDRKVFVVSAVSNVANRIECLEAGAVDFLRKPFDLGEFLARVEVRCSDGRHGTARRRCGHSLALDPYDRKVRKNGRWISLTDREYLLLSRLVESGEQACSRRDLLQELWGITDDDGVNTHVEMYISKLRRKLGRDVIQTVRGAGYRIEGQDSLGRADDSGADRQLGEPRASA
jgi:DNA-binding response OmpR family regulator